MRRMNRTSKASCFLAVMLLCVFLTSTAFASEVIPYEGASLTLEPSQDQLSIRLTPQLLGLWETYYFTPDAAAQQEIRKMLDSLKLLNYTIDEKFWQEHPEAGYTIVDTANQTEWMMLDGDHVLYTKWEVGEGKAFMHRRYAECPELTAFLQPLLDSTLQYAAFDVTTLTGLTEATLTLSDGQSETLTDPTLLSQIERWFSQARYMRAPSCPSGDGLLILSTGDGRTVELLLSTDSCPYFCINGVYYDYTPAELIGSLGEGVVIPNSFFFSCFSGINFTPIDLHPVVQ